MTSAYHEGHRIADFFSHSTFIRVLADDCMRGIFSSTIQMKDALKEMGSGENDLTQQVSHFFCRYSSVIMSFEIRSLTLSYRKFICNYKRDS